RHASPHTPQRSSRPGKPVALLDVALTSVPRETRGSGIAWSSEGTPGTPAPTPPSARRAPGNPWRSSMSRSPRFPGRPVVRVLRGRARARPARQPPHPPALVAPRETRGAPRCRAHLGSPGDPWFGYCVVERGHARHASPHTPQRSSRPGKPVALLDVALTSVPRETRGSGIAWSSGG